MRFSVAILLLFPVNLAGILSPLNGAEGPISILVGTPAERQAEARIRDALLTTITGNWFNNSLEFARIDLQRQLGVDVRLDMPALEPIAVSGETAVQAHVGRKSTRDALDILTRSIDPTLTWMIWGDSLWITTKEAAQDRMSTRVYPVGDLVVLQEGEYPDFEPLIDIIVRTIEPTTWEYEGGTGAITGFLASTAIVCTQTRDVHDQLENLLIALRQAQEPARAILDAYHEALRNEQFESDADSNEWDHPFSIDANGPVIDAHPAPWRVPKEYDN